MTTTEPVETADEPAVAKRRAARIKLNAILNRVVDDLSQPGVHGKREITISVHDGLMTNVEVVERCSHKLN